MINIKFDAKLTARGRLKIFGATAFYILLLFETIIDISRFLLIYLIAILAIGMSTMFLVLQKE